jgi:hypothetical protein
MKVITVRDTLPYGDAPTYQISLTYLERQNVMAWTRKYYLKNFVCVHDHKAVCRVP